MSVRSGEPPRRREHLDWLRGVAVLLMIDAHLFDSWTGVPDRDGATFRVLMLVGGGGTTLFLFLAGVASALSAGSKLRSTGRAGTAAKAVAMRGLEIFALAFVFRLQAWIAGWSHRTTDLLRVDILNIMGPSIVAAALLWRLGTTTRGRALVFAAATAGIAFLTPFSRLLPGGFLPDPIQAYIVPVAGFSSFVFFPWTALVLAGAFVGVLIDSGRTPAIDRQVHHRLAIGGAVVSLAALGASFLPTPFPASYFWTSSPAYLFLRCGLATLALSGAHAWIGRRGDHARWSPITQLGLTSLFIYWIHVELVYGLISKPWHRGLTLLQAAPAYLVFCGLMLACSIVKERLAQRVNAARAPRRSTPSGE